MQHYERQRANPEPRCLGCKGCWWNGYFTLRIRANRQRTMDNGQRTKDL